MLNKRFYLFLMLILCVLGANVYAQAEKGRKRLIHIGFFANLSAQHNHYVYVEDRTWGREGPDTGFKESFYSLSLFKGNSTEFDLFYRKFSAKSVFIAGGFWDTEKVIVGMSLGKVMTAEIKIPSVNISLPIDFSGGPYATLGYKNEYSYISGNKDLNVPNQKEPLIGFGIYTNIRVRIKLSQSRRRPSLTAGFKYFIPFNDFEYNPEKETVSYRLERKFFYIGISF